MLQGLPSSHPPLLQGRTPAKNANKHRILQRSYLRSMIKVDSEDGKTRFSGVLEYAGDHPCTVCDGPTKRPQYMRISRLITVTYLQNNFGVIFRQWQPAKPRTGMSIIWIFLCQTISIWQQHWLWGWQLLDTFSGPSTDPFLSGVMEVFLHVRCIPHQNSQ